MKHFFLFLLLAIPLLATAQDDYYKKKSVNRTYTITLKDGTQLRGELVRQDSVEALIRTRNLGEVRVEASQIVRIEQIGAAGQDSTYPNIFPQTMRITPTAFSAEKGKLYYRNYYISLSQFEYGITDNWSVGTTFYSFLPTNLFSVNTKLSAPVGKRVRLGINAQYAAVRTGNLIGSGVTNFMAGVGYVQGLVTTGDRQNNQTFGVGWSVSKGELSQNVVGTFGLVRKVSPKLSFITENLILFGSGAFAASVSGGVRFDRRRHAFDLAAYIPIISERNYRNTIVTFIPYGSYHVRIGKQ